MTCSQLCEGLVGNLLISHTRTCRVEYLASLFPEAVALFDMEHDGDITSTTATLRQGVLSNSWNDDRADRRPTASGDEAITLCLGAVGEIAAAYLYSVIFFFLETNCWVLYDTEI